MRQLDGTDLKVLFELDRNCRQTQKQIARRAGVTRDTVLNRARKLEEGGIVKGYYALIDFSKLGYMMVRVYIKFQNAGGKTKSRIIDYLVKEKTMTVYKTSGNWDCAFVYLVRSLPEFEVLWTKFLLRFKFFVREKNISLFYGYVHYLRNYLVPARTRDYTPRTTGGSEPVRVSESDMEFLRLIAVNGRMSLVEVARLLKMTPTAVKFKMRSLEKRGVILAYRAIVDAKKLGHEYYKVDLELNDVSVKESIKKFLRFHPNVVYENITFGGSDIEFDLEVGSAEDFENFMDTLHEKFPGAIKFFTFYKAQEILKYLYTPPA